MAAIVAVCNCSGRCVPHNSLAACYCVIVVNWLFGRTFDRPGKAYGSAVETAALVALMVVALAAECTV